MDSDRRVKVSVNTPRYYPVIVVEVMPFSYVVRGWFFVYNILSPRSRVLIVLNDTNRLPVFTNAEEGRVLELQVSVCGNESTNKGEELHQLIGFDTQKVSLPRTYSSQEKVYVRGTVKNIPLRA